MKQFAKAALCAYLLSVGPVSADVLQMKNGDRLSGKVVQLDSKQVIFSGPYAKRLPIAREHIQSMQIDEPMHIELGDGSTLRGTLVPAENGTTRVRPEDGAERLLELSAISAVREAPKPAIERSGGLNFGASLTSGNTETRSYHFDGRATWRGRDKRYGLMGSADYEEDADSKTVNEASLNADYAHFLSERWYFSSNLGFAHDEFADLDLRTTLGFGAGYQFFETPRLKLSAEAGLSYVWENYSEASNTSQPAARWALNYEQQLGDSLTLFHHHELFIGLEDVSGSLLNTSSGLRVPLAEQLQGTLQVDVDYNGEPAAGAEHVDSALLVLLGYTL